MIKNDFRDALRHHAVLKTTYCNFTGSHIVFSVYIAYND